MLPRRASCAAAAVALSVLLLCFGTRASAKPYEFNKCRLESRVATAASEALARLELWSASWTSTSECSPGFHCPTFCLGGRAVSCTPGGSGSICTETCGYGFGRCVYSDSSGGFGDPHLTGFDGSSFDFHGVPGKTFALFEQTGGDFLTTRIRGHGPPGAAGGAARARTYFSQFGLQPGGTSVARLRVAMSHCPVQRVWQVGLERDDVAKQGNWAVDGVSVQWASDQKVVLTTPAAEYSVTLMWPSTSAAHLNIGMRLLQAPKRGDAFGGVLGITLNARLGRADDGFLLPEVRADVRERNLRKRFEVASLFPARTRPE